MGQGVLTVFEAEVWASQYVGPNPISVPVVVLSFFVYMGVPGEHTNASCNNK